jgi:hypothetical protein
MITRARDGIVLPNRLYDDYGLAHDTGELHLGITDEPRTYSEAEHDGNWRRAMDEEMSSINENRT